MNINEYLDRPVEIEFPYIPECSYIDNRVGCDICQNGDAFAFKTNICEIIHDNKFKLNDLKIVFDEWYSELSLKERYICKHEPYTSIFRDLYQKVNGDTMKATQHYSFMYDQSLKKFGCGIGSRFSNHHDEDGFENQETGFTIICCHCFEFIKLLQPELDLNHFEEKHPLFLFWSSTVDEFLNNGSSNETQYLKNVFTLS